MKILINERQLNLLVEETNGEDKIYYRDNDPYEYKFKNGTWFARKKGTDRKFIDITKYQSSIDILNAEFPQKGYVPKKTTAEYGDINSKEFKEKLQTVANNLNVDKEWLLKVMKKESNLRPNIVNSIGCVGLIQFCPDKPRGNYKTIGNVRYDLNNVKNMSAVEQLDLVEEYYKPFRGKMKSYDDMYLATFYPAALGKPDHFVVGTEKSYDYAEKVSKQNPAIAKAAGKTPGEPLTISDFKDYTAA